MKKRPSWNRNTYSWLERQFASLLYNHRILGWKHNYPVNTSRATFYIDFAWPEMKLGVEVDSLTFHSSPYHKKKDRFRQTLLEELGWRIIRFRTLEITREPGSVIKSLLQEIQKCHVNRLR